MIVATNTQVRVLRALLEHPGAPCRDLAGLLGMSPAGCGAHLRALEKKGLAERVPRGVGRVWSGWLARTPGTWYATPAGEIDARPVFEAADVESQRRNRWKRIEAAARAYLDAEHGGPAADELRAALEC